MNEYLIDDLSQNLIFGHRYRVGDNLYVKSISVDAINELRNNVSDIKNYYLVLGKNLYEFKQNNLQVGLFYGHTDYDFNLCIKDNLGLDDSAVSRCINVYKRFCNEDGKIIDKYSEYNYSQLCEMVSLDDPDIITPNMTIKRIRDVKKEIKKNKKSNYEIATSQNKKVCNDKNDLIKVFIKILGRYIFNEFHNIDIYSFDLIHPNCIFLNVKYSENKLFQTGKYKLTLTKVK